MKWLCYKCLTANEQESAVCSKCRAAQPVEAEALPTTEIAGGAIDTPVPSGAGFGIRFLARMIDSVYVFLIGKITGFLILGRLYVLTHDWSRLQLVYFENGQKHVSLMAIGVLIGLGMLGSFLYHAVAEGFSTVTTGKLLCGLRVVTTDGAPVTMKGAFVRSLAIFFDSIFFGLIAYSSMQKSPLQQRYGDVWGETVVVKKSIFQPKPARRHWRMIVGILMGSLLWVCMLVVQTMIIKVR